MSLDASLQDRALIRERMSVYADAVFRRDVEAYLSCWADDGVRIGQGAELKGKAALRAQWEQIWNYLEKMAFFTETVGIAVTQDRATARCYCHEIMSLKNGTVRKVVGIYNDELVKVNEVWLFARREYELFLDEGQSSAASKV